MEWIIYKWLLVGLQVPCRSKSNGTTLGLALSCQGPHTLQACVTTRPTFHPAQRDHHRVTWEMLLVKVVDQCYQRLPNWEGVTGKAVASNPLDISPHRGNPQAHLWLGYGQVELEEAGGWMR